MTNIYERMNDYITNDGVKRFEVYTDGRDYLTVNTQLHCVIDRRDNQRDAEANAHYWNCSAFAREAINAKDANAIYAGLNTKDAAMRSAFSEAIVDALCIVEVK